MSAPGRRVCRWREGFQGRGRIPCRIGGLPEAGALPMSPILQGTFLVSQRVSLQRTSSPSGVFLDAPSGCSGPFLLPGFLSAPRPRAPPPQVPPCGPPVTDRCCPRACHFPVCLVHAVRRRIHSPQWGKSPAWAGCGSYLLGRAPKSRARAQACSQALPPGPPADLREDWEAIVPSLRTRGAHTLSLVAGGSQAHSAPLPPGTACPFPAPGRELAWGAGGEGAGCSFCLHPAVASAAPDRG